MKFATNEDDIKTELMTNGPMIVGFTVYDDFDAYDGTGIYEKTSSNVEGGHAILLVGWGYNSSRLYWICKNQWGATWGASGFFSIYANTAGLDAVAVGCEPDITAV